MQYLKTVYKIASKLPKEIAFGRSYREARKIHLEYTKSKNKIQYIKEYTDKKLNETYKNSKKCAFYSKYTFANGHAHLGFIDKTAVLSAGESIIRTKRGADLVTTGGTSGKPLAFYIDKSRKGFEWYWMTTGWRNAGFNPDKSWRAVLRNHDLAGKEYSINPLLKEVQFNNFNLNKEYLQKITEVISEKHIEFVHAYPSAAFTLAKFWEENANKPSCIKAFLCGSENILREQKNLIQNILNIRMLTWYGHSEKLILAHEGVTCEHYHCNPFYGYAEIIDENGRPATHPGDFGELVGTGFINSRTPFIRYRTGDYAEFVGNTCPNCGHIGLTFKNIKGRWNGDKILLSNNTFITTTALNLHDKIYTTINGLQYFQKNIGNLEVRILPGKSWTATHKNELLDYLYKKVPVGLEFHIQEVSELELTENRKFQLLIQRTPTA